MGWWSARRAGGFAAVAAVVAGAVVAGREEVTAPAAAVETRAETAWLAEVVPGAVVLADAATGRAVTTVEIDIGDPPLAVTQAGASAVVLTGTGGTVIAGDTWDRIPLATPIPDDTFPVGGPSGAWLISPGNGTAQPVDAGRAAAPAGQPIAVAPGTTPHHARVTDDGTLWVLDGDALRGLRLHEGSRDVPLGPVAGERALTLLDGDPVVIERERARRIDPSTATITAEWALDLPAGALVPAERSTDSVVVRVGNRIVTSAPGRPAAVALTPIDTSASLSVPVERHGLVHVGDPAGAILVVDPTQPDAAGLTRIPLGGPGTVRLFEHEGHVWYERRGEERGRGEAGLVTDSLTARPVPRPPRRNGTHAGAGDPGGRTDENGWSANQPGLDGTGEGSPHRAPVPPGIEPRDTACARTWPAARCLPEPRLQPDQPASRPDGPVVACPPGAGFSCALASTGTTADGPNAGSGSGSGPATVGGPASGGPGTGGAGGHDRGNDGGSDEVLRIGWEPERPRPGEPVTFTDNRPEVPGERRWRFEGTSPTDPAHPSTVSWTTQGDYTVELTIAGSGLPPATARVPVEGGPILPPELYGTDAGTVTLRLAALGVNVVGEREVPSLDVPRGHVVRVRHNGVEIPWGDAIGRGLPVTLDISDGTLPVRTAAGGRAHTCALTTDGRVTCWGANESGQLGTGDIQPRAIPAIVDLPGTATAVTAGDTHSCALLDDATAWCWGGNGYGQLGDGTRRPRPHPGQVAGALRDQRVRRIAAGGNSTCAVDIDGRVWCWGEGSLGTLGREVTAPQPTPMEVPGLVDRAETVHVGVIHACATLDTGHARCWGADQAGQLGSGRPISGDEFFWDLTDPPTAGPTRVTGIEDVADVGAGFLHSCALRSSGAVTCWGLNSAAQLGNLPDHLPTGEVPPDYVSSVPVPVVEVVGAIQLAVGGNHTCARTAGGLVQCWGDGTNGQLGTPEPLPQSAPVPVLLPDLATYVAAGDYHTCAVAADESLHCWGLSPTGTIGSPEVNYLTPTRIRVERPAP